MGRYCYKRYSVYRGQSEAPLVLYGTAKECSEAMGIKLHSFYEYVCRMKQGKIKSQRWLVYEDEVEDEDDT